MNTQTNVGNARWYISLTVIASIITILVFVTNKNLPGLLRQPTEPYATPTIQSYTITVSGEKIWYNTNIQVVSGQKMVIHASGDVFTDAQGSAFTPNGVYDPQGSLNPCHEVNTSPCLLDGAPYGALVGKISDNAPFLIGEKLEDMTIPFDGILFLSMNDNYKFFNDNRGAFNVIIMIQ